MNIMKKNFKELHDMNQNYILYYVNKQVMNQLINIFNKYLKYYLNKNENKNQILLLYIFFVKFLKIKMKLLKRMLYKNKYIIFK